MLSVSHVHPAIYYRLYLTKPGIPFFLVQLLSRALLMSCMPSYVKHYIFLELLAFCPTPETQPMSIYNR